MGRVTRERVLCACLVLVTVVLGRVVTNAFAAATASESSLCPLKRVVRYAVRGIFPGMKRADVEWRLGAGHSVRVSTPPMSDRAVDYGDVYVRFRHGCAIMVAGRQLDHGGRTLLRADQSVADADALLGNVHHSGVMHTEAGDQPAIRYDAAQVTVVLVPDTATISVIALTADDGVVNTTAAR